MTPQSQAQPKLGDLLSNYLNEQARAQIQGLAAYDAGEVSPYEAGPVQPIDPKPAWDEALTALHYDLTGAAPKLIPPPHWPQLVAGHEPIVALAWCAGNFPQLVRNFHPILHHANLSELRPAAGRPTQTPALLDWARRIGGKQSFPDAILALGALRLAKQFDEADVLTAAVDDSVPQEWRAAWHNELAALAWHRGAADEALRRWNAAEPTLPVLFNRGMALLFTGQASAASKVLKGVIAQIPESSGWHHLARLYLALAEQR